MSTASEPISIKRATWDDLPDHYKDVGYVKMLVLQSWEVDELHIKHLSERIQYGVS